MQIRTNFTPTTPGRPPGPNVPMRGSISAAFDAWDARPGNAQVHGTICQLETLDRNGPPGSFRTWAMSCSTSWPHGQIGNADRISVKLLRQQGSLASRSACSKLTTTTRKLVSTRL